jgi:hypothetical protein
MYILKQVKHKNLLFSFLMSKTVLIIADFVFYLKLERAKFKALPLDSKPDAP